MRRKCSFGYVQRGFLFPGYVQRGLGLLFAGCVWVYYYLDNRPNWIRIYGECYYRQEVVLTGFQDDDLPSFGKIKDILLVSGSIPLLYIQQYRTNGINSHVAAYQVEGTNNKFILILSNLESKQPLNIHPLIGDGLSYIVMKYHVPNC